MKKMWIILLILLAVIILFFVSWKSMTGRVIETQSFGPSQAEQQCMISCTTKNCSSSDMACRQSYGESCQKECGVIKPQETGEESCVSNCVKQGCEEYDFSCQQKNQAVCDKQCGMIKEPEAKSEEEQCIRDCVNAESPGTKCQAGEGGEKGNELCQRCAKSCEHLYAGPCLTEIKLEEAKSACNTCEHCYGKPVMGDSGEGYECIVSIECADASSEFGDNPGEGPGIGQEGFVAQIGDAIGNVVEAIGNFFSELF